MYALGITLLEMMHPFKTGMERIDVIRRVKVSHPLSRRLSLSPLSLSPYLSLYICIYMCIYIYIKTYVHIYIYIYVSYMYVNEYTCIVYMIIFIYKDIHTYMNKCIYIDKYTYINMNTYMNTYTYI